nr:antitoxin Xre/MbcA/ParS toxin-binding domain-containing protein [Motilibacter deserti]
MIAELLLRDPDGSRLDRVDDPDALARETAGRVVDTAAAWEAHLGAFYDVDGVRALLSSRDGQRITKQAVSKRKGLLALTTGSGRVVYPRFQFSEGAPLAGLDAVLAELPEPVVSRWTVASWLVSPQPALDGERPVDVLREGFPGPVVAAARGWARSLAA